jgi:gliding motility-associated-like protein
VIGCDSAWISFFVQLPTTTLRLPLTYQYLTKNGVYIPPAGSTIIDSVGLHTTGLIFVEQMIPNVTYGDTIESVIYNSCGDSLNTTSIIYPYTFYPEYNYTNCGASVTAVFSYTPPLYPNYGIKGPITYSLIDTATNILIDSATIPQDPTHAINNIISSITINPALSINKTYKLTVTDGCGKVFSQNYTVTPPPSPVITNETVLWASCLDSTVGVYRAGVAGFGASPKLIVTSGPTTFQSTKPHYSYTDNYIYPDTLDASPGFIFLQNLAVGTYYFKVVDDCGSERDSSITINPSDVTSLSDSFYYTKGCPGQNTIYYSFVPSGMATIRNVGTNAIVKTEDYPYGIINGIDSILNIPTGTYELTVNFEQGSYGTSINKKYTSCWIIKDTLTIAPYQAPTIATNNYIVCNGGTNVELVPDSSKGVLPYQYAIISGPQTFPVQNSNIFPVTQPGVYQARISDACGNASTNQITVDTLSLPPINNIANSCNSIKLFYGSSMYFTYVWTKPNGTIYTGDTLTINSITPADTGTYYIQKIVNINSCTDTFHTSYSITTLCVLPTITSFTPDTACAQTNINIIGTNFSGATAVSFGGTSAISFIVNSPTSITAILGTGSTGIIEVTTPEGVATSTDSIIIKSPANGNAGNDTTIIKGSVVNLIGTTSDVGATYTWTTISGVISNPDSLITQGIPNDTSTIVTYTLQVTNVSGCKVSLQKIVAIDSANSTACTVKPTNAFTPNGDGYNDVWVIYEPGCIKQLEVDVYNRWGSLVYHADNYNNDWNGEYQNKPLPDATYYYVIKPVYADGSRPVLKGSVTILR